MYGVSAFPTVQETSAIAVVVTTALVELEVLKLNSEKKIAKLRQVAERFMFFFDELQKHIQIQRREMIKSGYVMFLYSTNVFAMSD